MSFRHAVTAEEKQQLIHSPLYPFTFLTVVFLIGKVNMEALVRVYEKQRQCLESSQRNRSELRQILQTLWRVFSFLMTTFML